MNCQTIRNKQNIQNMSKTGLLPLPPLKCNSYLFFKRECSSQVHMLNDTKESKAAVVFYNKHCKYFGSYKGLIFS